MSKKPKKKKSVASHVLSQLKADNGQFRKTVLEAVVDGFGTVDDEACHALLTGKEATLPTMPASDCGLRHRLIGKLYKELPTHLINKEVCFARIRDCGWSTSDRSAHTDWKDMGRGRSLLRKLGDNCVAMTQLVHRGSLPHADGGFTIDAEFSALLWGTNFKAQCEKYAAKMERKFQCRPGAAPAIKLEWLEPGDERLLPILGEMFGIGSTADPGGPSSAIATLRRLHVLASCRADKLAISTGWGKRLLDGFFADEKRRIALAQKDVSLALHPDGVTHYLASFMKRCEYPYDTLPFVRMR